MKNTLLTFLLLGLLIIALAGCSGSGATITWKTASEVDTAGFNLYRATSPEGPWIKINDELIPPSQDPVSGGSYEFKDQTAEPGKTYYYRLEEIELSGNSNRFDPIKLQTGPQLPAWHWWVLGAVVAIGIGWLAGNRLGGKEA